MKNLISAFSIFFLSPILLICAVQSCKALSWVHTDNTTALSCLLYQECPKDSHMETIKALTVLLRSSLCLYTSEEWNELLKNSTNLQQEKEYIRLKNTYYTAMKETDNLVLKYRDSIMRGVYHEISGGTTRSGKDVGLEQYRGLVSVDSSFDKYAEGYLQVFSFSDIYLKRHFFSNLENIQLNIRKTDQGGYVQQMEWGNTYADGDYVRESLSLPSSCFTISRQEGQWIFTCRGVGHGLGMSLYGANILAESGKDFKEILEYYFPSYDILPE